MNDPIPKPAGGEPAPDLDALRALLGRQQYAAALACAERLLEASAGHRDFLYVRAVAQRYLGRTEEALATLATLEVLYPTFSRLYQERGHCHVGRREAAPAIQAFLRAVNLNPTLTASWHALRLLFGMTGDANGARTANEHLERLAGLPAEVLAATDLYSDGDWAGAEALVRPFLLRHPQHVEAMRLLARIGLELDVLDDAEFLLEAVLELDPDYRAARYDYVRVLLKRHKHAQALRELDRLLAADPADVAYRTTYATTAASLGDPARAVDLYEALIREMPLAADLHLSLGHVLKTMGRTGEAIAAYREAARVRPDFGDAYWSLANLKTYRFDDTEIATMQAVLARPVLRVEDRYHLCFALGKALEDRGDYAASFGAFADGNSRKRAEVRYRPELIERNAEQQATVCTAPFFLERQGFGCPDRDPIFIVGLPRSGSTLLEQILASHSAVEGTMELSDLPRIVQQLQGREVDGQAPRYPAMLAALPAEEYLRLGRKYLDDTRVYRSGRPYFIDKMPNNFRHIGLIHLMLPNARIIDARREAMACCFSNLKQLFASGQEFTYAVDDIARYYRSYVRLMAHWDEVLPGRVLRVWHEHVVDDLEGSVRRILDYCGLPFEPACVEFHRTARNVRTASSEQVRRPIYREGLEQWRHFEPYLGPLREALGDLAGRVGP
jgi:tetratricopeptide (TPR) repeat protein